MNEVPTRFWLSLPVALLLQLVALPDAVSSARPLIVLMVLVYWTLTEAQAPSLFMAFVLGLLLDAHHNTVMGQHAGCLLVLVYFVARLRAVITLLPLAQATIALAPVWAAYCLFMSLIDGASQHRADALLRWLPVLTTIPAWPLAYGLLDRHSSSNNGR